MPVLYRFLSNLFRFLSNINSTYIFLAGSTTDLNPTTIPGSQLTLVNPNQADQGAGHLASNPEGLHFVKCVKWHCVYFLVEYFLCLFLIDSSLTFLDFSPT